MKSVLFFLVLILLIVPVSAVDWHDETRLKRVQLNVNNSSVALTEYQMMKTIAYDNDMQSDFDDLLFYNESGGTVSYWIESKTDSNTAYVWLKIPSIYTAEGAKVWMYYENSSVSSAGSITDTMIFGDDFPGSSIDTGKWEGITSVTVSGGITTVDGSMNTITDFSDPVIMESRREFTGAASGNTVKLGFGAFISDSIWAYIASDNKLMKRISNTPYDVSTNWVQNAYYVQKIVWDGATPNVEWYEDNVAKTGSPSGTAAPTVDLPIYVGASGAGLVRLDWIFARKYTATEPTWGSDGEEESYEAPPTLNGTYLYPNSTYSIGYYGRLTSELVYETGINFSDIDTFNLLTAGDMEVMSVDDTNYIPSIDKDAAHDGYMYGNFSLQNVESVNFINVKTVHNRNETNPVILGLFNVSTQRWHAVNNSSVEIVDVELTYNITGTDIIKYSTLIDNTLNLSVSLNTNGDGNYDVFVDYVEIYIDYEESPDITLGYVYNLTVSNQNNISILQNDVDDLENNMNNLYLFVLLCTVLLVATSRKRGDQ